MKIESILLLILVSIILLFIINKNNINVIMDKLDKLSNKISQNNNDKNINTVTENIIINKKPIGFKPY